MRKILLTFSLAGAVFAAGCAEADKPVANAAKPANTAPAPAPTQATPFPDVERISLADAKKDFDSGNAVFVDTRPAYAFADEHVVGAINVPPDNFQSKIDTLPKGKKFIVYCS